MNGEVHAVIQLSIGRILAIGFARPTRRHILSNLYSCGVIYLFTLDRFDGKFNVFTAVFIGIELRVGFRDW